MQGEHVWHQVRKLSPIFTIPVTVTDKWSNLVYSNITEYGQSTTNNTISLSKANEIQLFTSKRQKTITTALIQASVTTLKTVQPSTALNRPSFLIYTAASGSFRFGFDFYKFLLSPYPHITSQCHLFERTDDLHKAVL